jgi:hypothetical protein
MILYTAIASPPLIRLHLLQWKCPQKMDGISSEGGNIVEFYYLILSDIRGVAFGGKRFYMIVFFNVCTY